MVNKFNCLKKLFKMSFWKYTKKKHSQLELKKKVWKNRKVINNYKTKINLDVILKTVNDQHLCNKQKYNGITIMV